MKKMLLAAVVLGLASSGAMAKDWQTVRFGVDPTSVPFESKAADGKLVGFDIEVGNAVCRSINIKCTWVENNFDGMIPALKAKKFDAILSSMSITEKRKQVIAFSDKVYNAASRVVARKDSGLLPTADALKGKRVGVQQGTIQETYAKQYWEPEGVEVVPYQDQDMVLVDLGSGRLDATFIDAVQADIAFLRTQRGKDFTFVGDEVKDPDTLGSGTAIGLRQEDGDLRDLLNKGLAQIHQDGTYDRIAKAYFSFPIYD